MLLPCLMHLGHFIHSMDTLFKKRLTSRGKTFNWLSSVTDDWSKTPGSEQKKQNDIAMSNAFEIAIKIY